MLLTSDELSLIDLSLQTTADMTTGMASVSNKCKACADMTTAVVQVPTPKRRVFTDVKEQLSVLDVFAKIKPCYSNETNKYVESEVDFTTEEKTFILKMLDRGWEIAQLLTRKDLKLKLNAPTTPVAATPVVDGGASGGMGAEAAGTAQV